MLGPSWSHPNVFLEGGQQSFPGRAFFERLALWGPSPNIHPPKPLAGVMTLVTIWSDFTSTL